MSTNEPGTPTLSDETNLPNGIYHIMLFAFEGENAAAETVKRLKAGEKQETYDILEWAVVQRNSAGKVKVKQPGRGSWGAGLGGGAGAALALLGGPLGIVGATIVGALTGGAIGHFVGRNFDQDELKKAAAALPPNSSGFVALVQNTGAARLTQELEGISANVVTITAGSELSGALLHASAAEVEVEIDPPDDAPIIDTTANPQTASAATKDASADSSATTGGPAPSNAPPVEG